jgi:hypothetical protein
MASGYDIGGFDEHADRANNYIGAANMADRENPHVAAALARAEAQLAVACAIRELAAAVRAATGAAAAL